MAARCHSVSHLRTGRNCASTDACIVGLALASYAHGLERGGNDSRIFSAVLRSLTFLTGSGAGVHRWHWCLA